VDVSHRVACAAVRRGWEAAEGESKAKLTAYPEEWLGCGAWGVPCGQLVGAPQGPTLSEPWAGCAPPGGLETAPSWDTPYVGPEQAQGAPWAGPDAPVASLAPGAAPVGPQGGEGALAASLRSLST